MKLHLPKGLLVAVLAASLHVTSVQAHTATDTSNKGIYIGLATGGGYGQTHITGPSYDETTNTTKVQAIDFSDYTGTVKIMADAGSGEVGVNAVVETLKISDGVTLDFTTNGWDPSKFFDCLTINDLVSGEGEGTVNIHTTKDKHVVSIEQVSGVVGAINNTGTLSIGATGGTTSINGAINNTGALTLVGTIVASGSFVSNIATQNGYELSKSTIVGMTGNGTYDLTGASFQTTKGTAYTLQEGVYTANVSETDTQYHVVSGTTQLNDSNNIATATHTGFVVYSGATLDVNGKQNSGLKVELRSGSTLANMSNTTNLSNDSGYNVQQIKELVLTGDATVHTNKNMGVVAGSWAQSYIDLNENKLTKTGAEMFSVVNAVISAGEIDIQEGTVKLVEKKDGSPSGTLSMDAELIINVEEGASLDWWSDKNAKEYGGKEDTSYTSFLRNVTGEGTINIDLAAGSAVVIHGTETNAHKVDFSGTLNMSNDTKLVLGAYQDADDESYDIMSWGLDMSDTTISLNGGGLRFCGSNTTIGTLDINANENLFIQDTPSADTVGLTVNKLNLDANLSITNRWKGAIDIDVLQGAGNLSVTKGSDVLKVSIKGTGEDYTGAISVTNAELTLGTADSVVYLSKAITNNGSLTLANVSFALDNMAYTIIGDTSQTGVIDSGHKYALISGNGSLSVTTMAYTLNGSAVTDGTVADDKKSVTFAKTIYNIAAGDNASATVALQATAGDGTGVDYVNVLGTMTGLSESAWGNSSSTPIHGSGTVQVTGLLEGKAACMSEFTGEVQVDGAQGGKIHLGTDNSLLANATIELVGSTGEAAAGDGHSGYITGWGNSATTFAQRVVLKGGAIIANNYSLWSNVTVENAGEETNTVSYFGIIGSGTGLTGGNLNLNGGTLKVLNSGSHTMKLGGDVRFDGGALDLNNQTVDSGTRINNLQVVRDSTGHIKNGTVYISTFDMRGGNANPYGGTLELTNAHLQIDGAIWMHEENTQVLLHEDSSIKADYAVISHTGTDNDASIVSTGSGVANDNFVAVSDVVISNANVAVKSTDAKTVSSQLSNSSVENAGTGTLTATNAANNLSGINAAAGNINLQNVDLSVQQELLSLSIAEGMTVAAHVGTQELDSADGKVNLTVASTGTATFANNSTLNADLEIKSGAKVTANGALNLNGSALTLGTGITLDGSLASKLIALPADDKLALFSGITELNFTAAEGVTYNSSATVAYNAVDTTVDLTDVFSVEGVKAGMYELTFSDDTLWASQMVVPEPATTTLSLLALAGLCARRRRKS